ncbi:vascular cell adhesion protein 1-like [Dendropsophus ebraccatus]|uniref:vascular cell adhesion protein 1-like n=1 Tax=Dendropsophus ebraccatus TaxID=150705 RepID=UPI0038317011
MQCVYLAVVAALGVLVPAGQAEEPCELRAHNSEVFVPMGEWVLLNCTFTCPNVPHWEARLKKQNDQSGPTWTSVEVLVDDWEKSELYCSQSVDDGRDRESKVVVMAYALPSNVTIDLDEQMEEGKAHSLTCTVYEVAPVENLQIQLLRADTVIHNSLFTDNRKRGKQTVSAKYDIIASRTDNLQNFSCLATLVTTRNFTASSSHVTVTIYGQPDVPVITISPQSDIQEGDSFNITCLSDGSPSPTYHWTVPPGADVTYTQDHSTVLVTMAGQIHNGTYTCEARNAHGRVTASQNVQIIPLPKGLPRSRLGGILPAVGVFFVPLLIYRKIHIQSPTSVDSE